MGRIEDQITNRTKEFIADLSWYVHSANLLQADYIRAVNDLNRAFNEKIAEYKNPEVKPKRKRTRKSAKE